MSAPPSIPLAPHLVGLPQPINVRPMARSVVRPSRGGRGFAARRRGMRLKMGGALPAPVKSSRLTNRSSGIVARSHISPIDVLNDVVSRLSRKDKKQIFAFPVDAAHVPDYYQIIKNPMDFSTMRKKIENNLYSTFEMYDEDVHHIINNCRIYNAQETVFYKAADDLENAWQKLKNKARLRYKDAQRNEDSYYSSLQANYGNIVKGGSKDRNAGIISGIKEGYHLADLTMEDTVPSGLHQIKLSRISHPPDEETSLIRKPFDIEGIRKKGPSLRELFSTQEGIQAAKNLLQFVNRNQQEHHQIHIRTQENEDLAQDTQQHSDPFHWFNRVLFDASRKLILPANDEVYLHDKQLRNVGYRNSVLSFIGKENVKVLSKLFPEIEKVIEEYDPEPSVFPEPFNDIRLFGIDTDDFMEFNSKLTVDSCYLLGVGENHIRTALSLAEEPSKFDLSELLAMYYKYKFNDIQKSSSADPSSKFLSKPASPYRKPSEPMMANYNIKEPSYRQKFDADNFGVSSDSSIGEIHQRGGEAASVTEDMCCSLNSLEIMKKHFDQQINSLLHSSIVVDVDKNESRRKNSNISQLASQNPSPKRLSSFTKCNTTGYRM